MQALYPVELLSFEQRAKGMAFSSLCVNAALVLNGYAFSRAIKRIKWHVYFVYLGWCAVQTAGKSRSAMKRHKIENSV